MTPSSLTFLVFRSFGSFLSRRSGSAHLASAALGLAASLVPLVVVMVLSQGMIQGIMDRSLETFTGHFQIHTYLGGADAREQVEAALEGHPEVKKIYGERQGFGLIYSGNRRLGVQLRAVEPGFLQDEDTARFLTLTQGAPLDSASEVPGILLGTQAAKKLGVKPGDEVKVMTARTLGGRGFLPRISTFRVQGLISVGYQDLDRLWVFLDHRNGVKILPESDSPLFFHVKVKHPYQDVSLLKGSLQDLVPQQYLVKSWQDLSRSQFENYRANRTILMVIMALIVLVAGVNISSSLVMVVLEKTKDIAILKSLGTPPWAVSSLFTSLGFLTGLGGTLLGLSLGTLVALNLNGLLGGLNALMDLAASLAGGAPATGFRLLNPEYYLETIPLSLDPLELTAAGVGALVVSTLAAYLPARKARKLRPVAILRKY